MQIEKYDITNSGAGCCELLNNFSQKLYTSTDNTKHDKFDLAKTMGFNCNICMLYGLKGIKNISLKVDSRGSNGTGVTNISMLKTLLKAVDDCKNKNEYISCAKKILMQSKKVKCNSKICLAEFMKYAFLTDNIGVLNKIQKPDILYFGNEFCQNIIPAKQHINKAFQWALKNNIQFVFVLPYITNDKVKTADSLLHILNNKKRNIEIVFNDWGTLSLILKYKNLQPVLGRLLTKQRKDPIAENIIQNTQKK
jgi:hypothetical protein